MENIANLFQYLEDENFVDYQPLCREIEKHEFPVKAKNLSGEWKYIINTDKYKQVISTHTCSHITDEYPETSCLYGGKPGIFPDATKCEQLYSNQDLLSISTDGSIEFDTFKFPSVCACRIIDQSYLN